MRRKHWSLFTNANQTLFSDHPDFPQFDDIEDDLNKVENTWGLFDEFHTSMKEMANEEWILFR